LSIEPASLRLREPARTQIEAVVDLLAAEPSAPSAVRDPDQAWRVHVADSLTGLLVGELRRAAAIADIGAGAGFPGIVLAVVLEQASVDLVESSRRKCDFIRRGIEAAGITNARVVCERAERWGAARPPEGGREAYDAVTARAVGSLAAVAELASPLLHEGGLLIAWKGRRDREEEKQLDRAASTLAMKPAEVVPIAARPGARHRHLHLVRKAGPTPEWLPRKAGMAKKRPFGRS
jgi:16S rRNA (guanine527-N7)-methyltransferase